MRRKAEGDYPMKFTSHSYLIYLFFNCPANSKLHCPDEVFLLAFHWWFRKLWRWWRRVLRMSSSHGILSPMSLNTRLWISTCYWFESSWSRSLIQFGIQMSNDLKRRFNKPDSIILNDNDVFPMTAVSWLGPRTNCWFDSYHAWEQHSCISFLYLLYW